MTLTPIYPFIFGTLEGPKITLLTTRSGALFLHSLRSLVRITRRKRPGNEILTSARGHMFVRDFGGSKTWYTLRKHQKLEAENHSFSPGKSSWPRSLHFLVHKRRKQQSMNQDHWGKESMNQDEAERSLSGGKKKKKEALRSSSHIARSSSQIIKAIIPT